MGQNRIAVFTTVNFNYVKYAVRCFELLDKHNPGVFDFHLICSGDPTQFIPKTDLAINLIDEDLNKEYKIEEDWPYPSECFWVFKGPNIMHDLGYKHSMYIDSDVVSLAKLDLNWLDDSFMLAGSTRMRVQSWKPNTVYEFISRVENNLSTLKSNFNLIGTNTTSINSGVLFFNNKKWVSESMFNYSIKIFNKSKDLGIPRMGDDSLLALLQLTTRGELYKTLSVDYNFYYERPYGSPRGNFSKIKLMHMTAFKPWSDEYSIQKIKNENIKKTCEIWIEQDMKKANTPSHALWWYRSTKSYNFGDEITPWLIQKMFGFTQSAPCSIKDPNVLLGVGSIMRLSNNNTDVWGPGIRDIDQNDFKPAKKVHAVRGLFSRNRLLELGHECPPVYGDPGLLLPNYYKPTVKKKYKLGIIPHIVDYEEMEAHFKGKPGVTMIDLKSKDIEDISRQVLECEHIVSTSLHGVITAVAYEVPVRWLKCSNKINGDDVKFYDFFSSIDHDVFNLFDRVKWKAYKDCYNALEFDPKMSVDQVCKETTRLELKDFDKQALIDACPFYLGEKPEAKIEYSTKISVVMPSYLGQYPDSRSNPIEKFNRAVQSFLNQDHENKELIIVSDGCELTNKQYDNMWSKYENIKLIKTDKSSSKWPGTNRQIGVDNATGEWITYLDSDDILHHSHLTNLAYHIDEGIEAIFNNTTSKALDYKIHGNIKGWMFVNGRKVHGRSLSNYLQKIDGNNLRVTVNGKLYPYAYDVLPPNTLKFGTCRTTHKKDCPVKWTDREARGEDIIFSEALMKKVNYKIINSPTYIVCHIPGRLDI